MNGYQERVHNEKEELDSRIELLDLFLEGSIWLELDVIDQESLREQRIVMGTYSHILGKRIARFK